MRDYIRGVIQDAPSPWRRCLRAFVLWLEDERGLAVSSVEVRVRSIKVFVEALKGPGGARTLKHLGVTDVEDFFIDYSRTHGTGARRSMQAAMRLFICFAVSRNWAKQELLGSVPSIRTYRLRSLPRGLSDDQVRALAIASAERCARDHSIVLLLLVYGIRRGQVVSVRLEDVNWRERTIVFRAHKNGKPVQHRLAPAVAAALATYLRTERPDAVERAVFLRSSAPHLPLGPSAVTEIVRNLLRRADITCSPHGPHALRHAFATRMLNGGHTLKSIADLLGHRSLEAVSIYAKLDHPRLLEVAPEWPEVRA